MDKSIQIMSDIIHHMKYAKYLPELKRRETWEETVTRNKQMHIKKFPHLKETIEKAYEYVYEKKVNPSSRSLQFSGKPIEINNTRLYNCSYLPIDHYKCFSETMFLLLSGCGVGYSVQFSHIEKLPELKMPNPRKRRHLVGDSIEGWSDAVKVLMKSYFYGLSTPVFDFSDIRPKGTPLKTSGGKAPGPQPLKDCLHNIEKILLTKKMGEKLSSLNVHDIICHIADAVLSGGIRRASLLCLFSFDDEEMISCKYGDWYVHNPQRGRANNSASILRHMIKESEFFPFWEKVEKSNSGEPGIYFTNNHNIGVNPCKPLKSLVLTKDGYKSFQQLLDSGEETFDIVGENGELTKCTKPFKTGENKSVWRIKLSNGMDLYGTENHLHKNINGEWKRVDELSVGDYLKSLPKIKSGLKIVEIEKDHSCEDVYDVEVLDDSHAYIDTGVIAHNCNEKSLPPYTFCNLTSTNVSNVQTQEELEELVWAASVIGTLQASYTDFHYLREVWKKNTEKEALLGVSMTGICSGGVLKLDLKKAAQVVLETNKEIAQKININLSARSTVVKPEGTYSLLAGTCSGIHPWHSDYFIRRIRVNNEESICKYLKKYHPELIEEDYFKPNIQSIITVPVKTPEKAITKDTDSVDAMLERIKKFHKEWIQTGYRSGHNTDNVSATVNIKDDEWGKVGQWLWDNRNNFNGLSVLPYDGGTYVQAPFEKCSKETYEEMYSKLVEVDLTKIIEEDDNTDLQGELSCAGGQCSII